MNLEKLLQEWGFQAYFEAFKENEIDLECLLEFTNSEDETLKTIIKAAGPRVRLAAKVREIKSAQVYEILSDDDGDNESNHSNEDENVGEQNQDHTEGEEPTVPQDQVREAVPGNETANGNGAQESDSPAVKRRRTTACSKGTVEKYLDCPRGLGVTTNYSARSKLKPPEGLEPSFKRLLVNVIIESEMQDANSSISGKRLSELADEIVQLFPLEVKGEYFIPYKAVTIGGVVVSKKAAKGMLWHKYNNHCKKLITESLRTSSHRPRAPHNRNADEPDADTAASILWLSGQTDVTEDVRISWKATTAVRITELRRAKSTAAKYWKEGDKPEISKVMVKFRFLKQRSGFSLLEEDFKFLHPTKEKALFHSWQNFAKKVIELGGLTGEPSEASILIEFAKLVAQNQKTKRVCKKWVANEQELVEGFVLHVKVNDCLKTETDRITNRALQHRLQVSPFAVIVGPDTEHITDSYIYIDGVQYHATSPLHAIDQTFKAIHALHVQYSIQSDATWLLFQRVVYGLQTPWDDHFSVVDKLLPKFVNQEAS